MGIRTWFGKWFAENSTTDTGHTASKVLLMTAPNPNGAANPLAADNSQALGEQLVGVAEVLATHRGRLAGRC